MAGLDWRVAEPIVTVETSFEGRLLALEGAAGSGALAGALAGRRIGLEKESLRVTPDGAIAGTPHPAGLGAPLTHPYVTTDFSEALIELVTPALDVPEAVLGFLADLHTLVYRHLGEEFLWGASMPCAIAGPGDIPLARYGTSNAATMKTVYRRGLANRYGRTMQAIAGVHFNFSFDDTFWRLWQDLLGDAGPFGDFRSEGYMGMVRNLQRVGWLIPYLFGASPAVHPSFVKGRATDLIPLDAGATGAPTLFAPTLFAPWATSLRMGDIGYQNHQEECTGIKANYDSLDAYIRSLTWAIETTCPLYEKIGVKVADRQGRSRYEQLSAAILQIENEYYSTVRPKQVCDWLEKPTLALRRRGIRYVELRSLDVNLFEPVGVGMEQLLFLETLMLHCLLSPSPRIGATERSAIDGNQVLAAQRGREPGLCLSRDGEPVALRTWAMELLADMAPAATLLDGAAGPRTATLEAQRTKVADPDLTPSARVLRALREGPEGFTDFAQRLSLAHRDALAGRTLQPEREHEFAGLAAETVRQRAGIEAADHQDFDQFLAAYFAQGRAVD